jgi:hypothetical protein
MGKGLFISRKTNIEATMIRQLIPVLGIIIFLTSCSSSSQRADLTAEEEDRFVFDKGTCEKKADESARGFGKGNITWELKRKEIYDYCMENKGWDSN